MTTGQHLGSHPPLPLPRQLQSGWPLFWTFPDQPPKSNLRPTLSAQTARVLPWLSPSWPLLEGTVELPFEASSESSSWTSVAPLRSTMLRHLPFLFLVLAGFRPPPHDSSVPGGRPSSLMGIGWGSLIAAFLVQGTVRC